MAIDELVSVVDGLFSDTMLRYPHTKMGPRERDAYFDDWCNVCRQMGVEKFTHAVEQARLYCKFFPQAADLMQYTPIPQLGKPSTHADDCACGGTGFVPDTPKPNQRHTRYRRCAGRKESA